MLRYFNTPLSRLQSWKTETNTTLPPLKCRWENGRFCVGFACSGLRADPSYQCQENRIPLSKIVMATRRLSFDLQKQRKAVENGKHTSNNPSNVLGSHIGGKFQSNK